MTGQRKHVLISYNDINKDSQNRDALIANQLADYLFRSGKSSDKRGYTESKIDKKTSDKETSYDWMILIYSPDARKSPVYDAVENALTRTVERSMRGVLAITPNSADSLPPEWVTIRKYDANPQELAAIGQAMSYAKTPYKNNPTVSSILSGRQYLSARVALVVSLVTVLLVLALGAYFITLILPPTTPQATLSSSDPIQDIQALKNGLRTALANTQASATASTQLSAQTQYDTIMKTPPTSTGFLGNEAWDTNLCSLLDAKKYQITVATPGQYIRCMATATNLKNFAYQVTMNISGDAGGVIFRSIEQTGVFYRFSVTPGSGEFTVIHCQSDCSTNAVGGGTVVASNQVVVDPNQSVTLTVIAKDSSINLYVNAKFVGQLTDKLGSPGAIGVYAASIHTPTTVTFTSPKVWQFDQQPKSR